MSHMEQHNEKLKHLKMLQMRKRMKPNCSDSGDIEGKNFEGDNPNRNDLVDSDGDGTKRKGGENSSISANDELAGFASRETNSSDEEFINECAELGSVYSGAFQTHVAEQAKTSRSANETVSNGSSTECDNLLIEDNYERPNEYLSNQNDYLDENNVNDDLDETDENDESKMAMKRNLEMANNAKRMKLELLNNIKKLPAQSTMQMQYGEEKNFSLIKCAVCSDTASGTRYGVCVCEGCKEFFRRQRENVNIKTMQCVNGTNECEINVKNRTQCRKCRFEKCLRLGMKLVGRYYKTKDDSIKLPHNFTM